MSVLTMIAGLVGFAASICTIFMFVEDRVERFHRRRRRRNKMMQKKEG